ncbi:MAG TPA: T9SS type A sorting domain-containing protein, partial [Saprospiraceae bacterium]|nr:T9SS type A sorting domain-containing protein [Saprospiraceae bacterium]
WQPTGTSENSYYLTAHNGYLFEWREFSGLFRSQNGGATWQSVGAGLGDLSTNSPFGGPPIYSGGNTLFLFDYYTIYASTNNGLTFNKINDNLLSQWGSTVGADLLVSDGTAVAIISSDGHLYYSPNLGDQWVEISANLPQPDFFYAKLALHGGYLYFAPEYSTDRLWRRSLAGFNFASLSGAVYRDDNNNGQQDAGELPYPGVLIQASSSAFSTSAMDGTYDLFADISGNDTLRILPPSPWVQANPSFYIATGPATGNNFGLYFPPDITDMSVVLTNQTVFRPGFDEKIYLTYRNPGTAQASGKIRFYAPAPLEFISAAPAPDQTDGDTLIWNFQNLPPFAEGQIIVTVHVETGTPLGSEVEAFASVQTDETDANQSDNQYLLKEIVLGSFDPNDKRCRPADRISPDQVAAREPLEYTVRFQNTGTYPAEFVRIADTLHQNLDVTTFRLLASSHDCQVSVREQGILEFYFDNIDLPPSTFNEPESHGFVKYRILPKPGLSLGAQILNTAYIFFDFNPAIVTNTTSTTVAWPLSTNSPALSEQVLVIFPNPAGSSVWINTGVDEPGRIAFFDVSGTLVLAQYTSGRLSKTGIEHLPSGQYIVQWISATGLQKTGKVLKR